MRGKRLLAVTVLFILVALVAALAGCGGKTEEESSKKPVVIAVAPESGAAGSQFEIIGDRFGDTQGDGVVRVGSKVSDVAAWTATRITVKVPSGLSATTQSVTVLTSEGASNYVEFSVIGGQGQQPERKEGQLENVTAAQAITEFEKKKGKDVSGMTFSIVQISEKDPNWKVDAAYMPGQPTIYFLLHKENGNWVVKDDGASLTKKELAANGAPGDLYGAPLPASQSDAVISYMKKQGMNPAGVQVVITKISNFDPAWEIGLARQAGQPDQIVVLHKEGSNWVVKAMGSNFTSDQLVALGVPKDITHTPTEAQSIIAWIQAGNAPPGVTATGWNLKVIKVSKLDGDWELIQGTQQVNPQPMFFLLHWENGAWAVKDTGGALNKQELSSAGAPADLP